jgi:hypothetical protein
MASQRKKWLLRGIARSQCRTGVHDERAAHITALLILVKAYCLLPSPLLRPSSSAVDGVTFMMKYPLP